MVALAILRVNYNPERNVRAVNSFSVVSYKHIQPDRTQSSRQVRVPMQDVFHEAVNLLDNEEQLVMATVVRTKGSTPQKPGAKLLVRADGTGVGTLGGGCVEGDIWYAATQLMKRGGDAQYREYELNEDLAAEDGLVCGGTMFFLIDPVYRPDQYIDCVREIDAAYAGGPSVAVASLDQVVRGHASRGRSQAARPRRQLDRGHSRLAPTRP